MIDLSKLVTQADKDAIAAAEVKTAMAAILTAFRSDREKFLNRLSGIGFSASNVGRGDIVQCVLAVREGLLNLTGDAGVLAATTAVGLKRAIQLKYASILSDVPVEVKAVFKEVGA
jgi:hypothetical protein